MSCVIPDSPRSEHQRSSMLRIVASDGAPGFVVEPSDALTPDTAESLRLAAARRGVCGKAESQKKFKKLKETFERRLETSERVEEDTAVKSASVSTEAGDGAAASAAETEARIETIV